MVNLNPSKCFDPATLADLYQVEVDYPEGAAFRLPKRGCYSPAKLDVDDVTFHLESDAKAWSFCLELVEAVTLALEWTQEDEHLDAASAEHGIQAIRRTILRLAELSARLRDIQVQQARSQDVGDQVLDQFAGIGHASEELSPGCTVVRMDVA